MKSPSFVRFSLLLKKFKRWVQSNLPEMDRPSRLAALIAMRLPIINRLTNSKSRHALLATTIVLMSNANFITMPARASDPAWKASIAEGDRRMVKQELESAEECYRRAYNEVRHDNSVSADDKAMCMSKLAAVMQQEDKTHDVIPLYKKALKTLEKAHGQQSVQLLPILTALGMVFEGEGDYKVSLQYYSRAASITESKIGHDTIDFAQCQHRCGRAQFKNGSLLEAESAYKIALTVLMHLPALPSPNELEDLLADYIDLEKKVDTTARVANSDFQSELLKDNIGSIGRTKGVAASAYSSRVKAQIKHGASDTLSQSRVPSLTEEERIFETDHRSVPGFGTAVSASAPPPRAVAQAPEPGIPAPTPGTNSLTQAAEPGLPASALAAGAPKLDAMRISMPTTFSATPNNNNKGLPSMTSDPVALDRISKQRVEFYERMIAVDIESLGPTHPSVARDLGGLATIYLTQRKYDQAKPLLLRALEIYNSNYGVDPILVERTKSLLAFIEDGKSTSAPGAIDDSFVSSLPTVPLQAQRFEVALRLNYLALLCFSLRKLDDAEKIYAWAVSDTIRTCGIRSLLAAASLADYSRVLRLRGRGDDADVLEKTSGEIIRANRKIVSIAD